MSPGNRSRRRCKASNQKDPVACKWLHNPPLLYIDGLKWQMMDDIASDTVRRTVDTHFLTRHRIYQRVLVYISEHLDGKVAEVDSAPQICCYNFLRFSILESCPSVPRNNGQPLTGLCVRPKRP